MNIIDVGCGPGIYVKALQEAGINAEGVDIDPSSPCTKIDIFSQEFRDDYFGKYDIAFCIEVAEHFPERLADNLVDVLTNLAPMVLFSAAVPGQGGHGHINCQHKPYWVSKFAEKNYVVDAVATEKLLAFMRSGCHMGWFIQNAVVFRQYGATCYDRIIAEETPQAIRLAEFVAKQGLA
jgi:2-polyprenyl-3-methyl-5-hydroxy-6-metoxy-1,4-benzoquinol methylase